MATAYSTVDTYNDIPLHTENFDLLFQGLQMQQQKIDVNASKVQGYIDQMTNIDLYRQKDKEYLVNNVTKMVNEVNRLGGAGFTERGAARKYSSYIDEAIDDKVLTSIASTRKAKSFMQEVQQAKEDGTYSDVNFAFSARGLKSWLDNEEVGAELKGDLRYVPYYDYTKDLNEVVADLYDKKTFEYTEMQMGSPVKRTIKTQGLSRKEIENIAMSQLNPKARQQMEIEATMSYGQYPERTTEAWDKYVESTRLELDKKIKNSKGDQKEYHKTTLANFNDEVNNLSEENNPNTSPSQLSTQRGKYLMQNNITNSLYARYGKHQVKNILDTNDIYFKNLDYQLKLAESMKDNQPSESGLPNDAIITEGFGETEEFSPENKQRKMVSDINSTVSVFAEDYKEDEKYKLYLEQAEEKYKNSTGFSQSDIEAEAFANYFNEELKGNIKKSKENQIQKAVDSRNTALETLSQNNMLEEGVVSKFEQALFKGGLFGNEFKENNAYRRRVERAYQRKYGERINLKNEITDQTVKDRLTTLAMVDYVNNTQATFDPRKQKLKEQVAASLANKLGINYDRNVAFNKKTTRTGFGQVLQGVGRGVKRAANFTQDLHGSPEKFDLSENSRRDPSNFLSGNKEYDDLVQLFDNPNTTRGVELGRDQGFTADLRNGINDLYTEYDNELTRQMDIIMGSNEVSYVLPSTAKEREVTGTDEFAKVLYETIQRNPEFVTLKKGKVKKLPDFDDLGGTTLNIRRSGTEGNVEVSFGGVTFDANFQKVDELHRTLKGTPLNFENLVEVIPENISRTVKLKSNIKDPEVESYMDDLVQNFSKNSPIVQEYKATATSENMARTMSNYILTNIGEESMGMNANQIKETIKQIVSNEMLLETKYEDNLFYGTVKIPEINFTSEPVTLNSGVPRDKRIEQAKLWRDLTYANENKVIHDVLINNGETFIDLIKNYGR